MKKEITIDDLPLPGEPLQERIAEVNQAILDDEIRERAERIQAKLKWWQRWKLQQRYKDLHRLLNRKKYNALVTERHELYQLCTRLKHERRFVSAVKREAMTVELTAAATRGIKVDELLAPLVPLAEEFAAIADRLRAHNDVIAWEKKEKEDYDAFCQEAKTWLEQIRSVCRQSARLHNAGTTSKGKYFCDIPVIERTIIKDDKVFFQIKTSEQGMMERFFGRWHSALPYDVDIPDLTCDDTLLNLSAGCKRVVTVERSTNGVNLFWVISRLDSPDGIPRKVLYSKVIEWYPIEDHRKTPWSAGVTNDRKAKFYNFEDNPHVLIAGTSGGGKSTHLNGMIATISTMNRPDEVRMLFIDLKGGIELNHWKGLKHSLGAIVKTPDKVLVALRYMREIMENRLEIFDQVKAKNLQSYNEKVQDRIPRLLVFVDEMATLIGLGQLTDDIHNELSVLSSQGRAVGIHLVLCTQHPSREVVIGRIKTNMSIRIASKMPSHVASEIILDTVSAALLPSIPGRMVFSIGRDETVAQSPYISDAEIASAVRISQAFPEVDEEEFIQQPVIVKPKFAHHDVIEMAITKFGGKLSVSRIHEEVGNTVVSERKLKILIEDIWEAGEREVEHNGFLYRLHKVRKTWQLDLIGPVGQQDNNPEPEDTDEFRPIERPNEDRPIEMEAIA